MKDDIMNGWTGTLKKNGVHVFWEIPLKQVNDDTGNE